MMNSNDDKLRALLRQWRDLEPGGNFEANVRRRIRLATEQPRQSWHGGFLYRPAFAVAAIAISIVIGSTAGVLSAKGPAAELQFMSAGTLAGGYVRLSQEAHR